MPIRLYTVVNLWQECRSQVLVSRVPSHVSFFSVGPVG
jgi:hypothetical protein